MIKNSLIFFLLFTNFCVVGQEVITNQGGTYVHSNGIIDFTIGEVIIETGTNGTLDITQGFHQTYWNIVKIEEHDSNYQALVFPNPTSEILNIRTNNFENITYSLYDAQKKLIIRNILSSNETLVLVNHLEQGNYFLILNNRNNILKTFHLIKQ